MWGEFLAGTGGDALLQLRTLALLSGETRNPFRRLDETTAELISAQADTAVVRLRSPGEEVREEAYVKVEGRWVPKTIAEGWKTNIQQAKSRFADSSATQHAQKESHILRLLNLADDTLNELATATSIDQFDVIIVDTVQRLSALNVQAAGVDKSSNLVTLIIQGEFSQTVEQQVRDLAGKSDFESFPDDQDTIVKIGSVPSVQELADRIRFGTVKEIDVHKRLIKVQLAE